MKNLFLIWLFSSLSTTLFATHNRAGEIRYEQIAAMQYRITIVTYTREDAVAPPDRDSLNINFGDGIIATIGRSNGINNQGVPIGDNYKYNEYVTEHTYSALGTYTVRMRDVNRTDGILNIDNGLSGIVAFYIESTIVLRAANFGRNSLVHLLQPPVDVAQAGQPFSHNPSAFDIDGDSITYEFITPLQNLNTVVPNYVYPNFIPVGGTNSLTINAVTGDIVWSAPQTVGEYSLAILIKEFRNGIMIGSTVRDMQILVKSGSNQAPILRIAGQHKIALLAGATLAFSVETTDANAGQRVQTTASSGVFLQNTNNPTPATFGTRSIPPYTIRATNYLPTPTASPFEWHTQTDNIRKETYQILFRSVDNNEVVLNPTGTRDTLGLNGLQTIQVIVVGTVPSNPTSAFANNVTTLQWDKPYMHENIGQNRFKGFAVWRKNGNNTAAIDTFNINPTTQGFTRIARNVLSANANKYLYNDATMQAGQNYTYWITAEFADLDAMGIVIHTTNSLPAAQQVFTATENPEKAFARVFPTLFTDAITIELADNTVLETVLYNSVGQVVLAQKISTTTLIPTQNLVKGTYLLRLKDGYGAQQTIKLVK
jgi:hypothetical protein